MHAFMRACVQMQASAQVHVVGARLACMAWQGACRRCGRRHTFEDVAARDLPASQLACTSTHETHRGSAQAVGRTHLYLSVHSCVSSFINHQFIMHRVTCIIPPPPTPRPAPPLRACMHAMRCGAGSRSTSRFLVGSRKTH